MSKLGSVAATINGELAFFPHPASRRSSQRGVLRCPLPFNQGDDSDQTPVRVGMMAEVSGRSVSDVHSGSSLDGNWAGIDEGRVSAQSSNPGVTRGLSIVFRGFARAPCGPEFDSGIVCIVTALYRRTRPRLLGVGCPTIQSCRASIIPPPSQIVQIPKSGLVVVNASSSIRTAGGETAPGAAGSSQYPRATTRQPAILHVRRLQMPK